MSNPVLFHNDHDPVFFNVSFLRHHLSQLVVVLLDQSVEIIQRVVIRSVEDYVQEVRRQRLLLQGVELTNRVQTEKGKSRVAEVETHQLLTTLGKRSVFPIEDNVV